jgi:REP element-mobilizing transposase RayT
MALSPKPQRHGPPHNPGVRELVANQRRFSSPPKREAAGQGFRGWHERGYLPHRDEPGLTQFVTFRLVDSFPEALRSEWEHLWKIEDERERRTQLETYLDKGRGDCHLCHPEIAQVVEEGLRLFQGKRYELRAWVVMSNHVHALFKVELVPLSQIVASWKKHTGRLAHRLLKQQGAFWAADYWDTFMRDAEHEAKTQRYIENNPTKAGQILDPKEWKWSSARFRDRNGVLKWPEEGDLNSLAG